MHAIAKRVGARTLLAAALAMAASAAPAAPEEDGPSEAAIRAVQIELNYLGYEAGEPDGVWGEGSAAALKAYERDWRIEQKGVLTEDRFNRLMLKHPDTKPRWTQLANSKCRVWNAYPLPRAEAVFTGDCKDGKLEGEGLLLWTWTLKGERLENGYGVVYQNGEKVASFYHADAPGYSGGRKGARADGEGSHVSQTGAYYKGGFKDGQAHGRGVSLAPSGRKYEGAFKDGQRHGQGVHSWPSGDRYEGGWSEGLAEGQGTYAWANGDSIAGVWKQGCVETEDGKRYSFFKPLEQCGFGE